MSESTPPSSQRQAFAEYVASCRFFDETGYLDLEKLCVHLYLALYCDKVPAPEPIAIYELLLKQVGTLRDRKKLDMINKQYVPDWQESMRSYYPDQQRTSIHFELMAEIYTDWIQQVGTALLKYPNPLGEKGRFWIKSDWSLASQFISRLEIELVRLAGLSRFLDGLAGH